MRRRIWIGLLAAPVLLAGAHYAYWRLSMTQLERGLAAWTAQRRQAGWSVTAGTPVPGGYPLAAWLSVPDVRLRATGREAPADLDWTAERVELRVALAQPGLLRVAAMGQQRIRLADGPVIPFRAMRLSVLFPLDPGVPHWAEVTAADLRAVVPGPAGPDVAAAGEVMVGGLRAHADLRPAAPAGEAAVALTAEAEAIRLPGNVTWPLGSDVAHVALEGRLSGPLPRGGAPALAAAQWRDGGGTLEVAALRLQWGKLAVDASATLALDERLQPMGSGTARMRGHDAAIDALTTAGVLTPATAQMARAMVRLFADPRASGGAPAQPALAEGEAEFPLSLQNRRLFTRQLPLARLPALRWPGP